MNTGNENARRLNLIDHSDVADIYFSRFALFLVYAWFGLLKIIGVSPASPIVADLLSRTLPFISFSQFIILFGIYEVLIGILFLIPKLNRVAIFFLTPHIIMTTGPIFLLPAMIWSDWFVPTLEGQYIIKNILIVALAIHILSNKKPARSDMLSPTTP